MQEIDQEYTGKVKELENLFKDAKMTNVSGGRAIPNVDFNSYYAFLWYSRMDVCKQVIFQRVFKSKMVNRLQPDLDRLLEQMKDKYQAALPYPEPYLEMREADIITIEDHMNQFLENNFLFSALSQILIEAVSENFEQAIAIFAAVLK